MLTDWCNRDDGPAEQRKDTLTVMDGVVNLTESAITQEGHGPLSTWGGGILFIIITDVGKPILMLTEPLLRKWTEN